MNIIDTNINKRIVLLIKELHITKTKFAETLKVTQAYISKLSVSGMPSDVLIDSICRNFQVNEEWLRYGTGEIFIDKTIQEEAFGRFGYLMGNASNEKRSFVAAFLGLVQRLPDEDFEKFMNEIQNALKESE